jgi:hypothetical protein
MDRDNIHYDLQKNKKKATVSGVKGFKVIVEVTPQLSAFTRMLTE